MLRFFMGVLTGIYADQHYNIPDVERTIQRIIDYLNEYKKP